MNKHHIAVQTRVAAFTMFCNHVSKPIIAKTLSVAPSTIHRWEGEDGWQERRDALLKSEIVPSWAQALQALLLNQYQRLIRMEAQLVALGSSPSANLPDDTEPEKVTFAELVAQSSMAKPQ